MCANTLYAANHHYSRREDETACCGQNMMSGAWHLISFPDAKLLQLKNTVRDRRWEGNAKLVGARLQGRKTGRVASSTTTAHVSGDRGHELRFQPSFPSFWEDCFDFKPFHGTIGLSLSVRHRVGCYVALSVLHPFMISSLHLHLQ